MATITEFGHIVANGISELGLVQINNILEDGTLLNVQCVRPGAIASEEAFGTAKLNTVIFPSAIGSTETFGTHTILVGEVTLLPSAISSEEAFGTPHVSGLIIPTSIPSAESFGTPKLNLLLLFSAIPSEEAFGTASIIGLWVITPPALSSEEACGIPTVIGGPIIEPSSIPSEEAFGTPTVIGLWIIVPSSIASAGAFGSLSIVYAQVIVAASIASTEAFGTANVGRALQHLILEAWYGQHAKGVNRAQVFGDDVFTEDWDWDELALVFDQLAQAHDLNLDSVAKAHARGGAMLRAAEIHARAGYIIVPLNCGQELYDVVQITDSRAGLIGVKRRVLALQHTYHPEKGTYALKLTIGAV